LWFRVTKSTQFCDILSQSQGKFQEIVKLPGAHRTQVKVEVEWELQYCNIIKRRVENVLKLYLRVLEKNPESFEKFFEHMGDDENEL